MSKTSIRRFVKHTAVYGLGGVLNRLIGFVLLPVYTRFLTPADYGTWALLVMTMNMAVILAQMGIGSAMFREVLYQGSDESTVESTALYFLLVESALVFGVLVWFSPDISTLIFGDTGSKQLLSLVFLTGFLRVFEIVAIARLRILQRSALYSLLTVGSFLIGVGLNVYYIVFLGRGVEGLVMAGVILGLVQSVIYFSLLLPQLRPRISRAVLWRMLKFGVPLVPFGFGQLILSSSDRYFLKHFATTADVGVYSLGYSIGMVLGLAVRGVQLAWPAQMFQIAKEDGAERTFARMLTFCFFVLGSVALGLSVLAREVLTIMASSAFHEAYKIVPFAAYSYVLYGAMQITNTGLETRAKTKYLTPIMIGAAAVNLLLNFLLIPRFGVIGAGWATILAYLFLAVVQVRVNLQFLSVPYEYGRLAKLVVAWAVIYGTSLAVQLGNVWAELGFDMILLGVAYPILLYLMGFWNTRELEMIKGTLRVSTARLRAWKVTT